ncbi:hypothetical protein Gohar_009325 [Gossypium harknessii]|uniref:Uncharacterized protein n=1 Tax=Gossypium harknessii TaxID=34285 RepID=A0A7J9GPR1_9ROSI|nr:hypothetical protein [Gossypium harknessii]
MGSRKEIPQNRRSKENGVTHLVLLFRSILTVRMMGVTTNWPRVLWLETLRGSFFYPA